jgi:hypothetical protein
VFKVAIGVLECVKNSKIPPTEVDRSGTAYLERARRTTLFSFFSLRGEEKNDNGEHTSKSS